MTIPDRRLLRSAALALSLAAPGSVAAQSASDLPSPHLSRALDALLIPVDSAVRTEFGLPQDETGLLVLAVAPGGVAEAAGLEPGDVIGSLGDRPVAEALLLDQMVLDLIRAGHGDLDLATYRGPVARAAHFAITVQEWNTVADVSSVDSWSRYASESFDYEAYTEAYSEEISASYEEEISLGEADGDAATGEEPVEE